MGEILIPRRTKVEKGYELLADITVDSSITAVDIAGLDIGKDDEIVLVAWHKSVESAGIPIHLYFNGNTSTTISYNQRLTASGTSVTAAPEQSALIFTSSNQFTFATINIKLTNSGYIVWQSNAQTNIMAPSSMGISPHYGTTTITFSSITSMKIMAQSGYGDIAAGSRFQLYRIGGA